MSLQDELDGARKTIRTDSYAMSVGELVNLYRDGELDIHPEFQRFYRWSSRQKSMWIESILLGIPLPSIFVAQREDGVWDVIDGLQRISTILQLMGELKDEDGNTLAELILEETSYMPSLKGKRWSGGAKGDRLTSEQQRLIKRAKLDIKIILRESYEGSKYELFQRLNTGGSFLSDQELRSCLLISVNRDFYRWLHDLAQSPDFQSCLPITDRQRDEQYDLELAVRFVVLRTMSEQDYTGISELGEFLSARAVGQAESSDFPYTVEKEAFETTFALLNAALESDVFRKYEPERVRFTGGFLISAFEVIALGVGHHYKSWDPSSDSDEVARLIKEDVWAQPDFLTSSGVRATQRIPQTVKRGREAFKHASS